MREAVGGSLLFYIVITFLVIYIVFIGFIMNYASAYRAGNYVVSQIEACEADMNNCGRTNFSQIKDDIKSKYRYLGDVKYCCYNNAKGSVYRATLSVEFELPLIGKVSPFLVKSETKTIYGVSCSDRNIFNEC